jgi:hypothetical protein
MLKVIRKKSRPIVSRHKVIESHEEFRARTSNRLLSGDELRYQHRGC